ncbi:hypothetical protein N7541_004718 [Penicillium brevicompactum]|uniref:Rhodopsin domain-containing protein n=1 Tax=Penicillium brevicompactum TaxID=5074 RepID=A0A9W9RC60_PENBR|nr:hypothetical protein N7541_004718 [Penicillium brevicompactum]
MYILTITTIFTALATLTVILRLFTRFYLIKSPGFDDVLVVGATITNIVYYALVLVERKYGLGVPQPELSDETIQGQLYYLWLAIPFYNLSLILSKLSALCLFVRLFRSRFLVRTSYISMGFLVIVGLWMLCSGFFGCVPIHYFWTLSDQERKDHCMSMDVVWLFNAAVHIFSDVVILILPMPQLWKLQIPRQLKLGIFTVFGLGICVIATSSVRLYYLTDLTVHGGNFTKINSKAAVWSSLEANISIICVCLPPLHPLLSRVFSLCFLPQPLHSSPATRTHSHTTQLTERKPSIYDHYSNNNPDGGVWYNEIFTPGPTSYTASISKVNTKEEEPGNQDGIRVVRELRMQSDNVYHTPELRDLSPRRGGDLEMAEGASNRSVGNEGRSNPSIEWDLGDFEFPDYKERMNAPI